MKYVLEYEGLDGGSETTIVDDPCEEYAIAKLRRRIKTVAKARDELTMIGYCFKQSHAGTYMFQGADLCEPFGKVIFYSPAREYKMTSVTFTRRVD